SIVQIVLQAGEEVVVDGDIVLDIAGIVVDVVPQAVAGGVSKVVQLVDDIVLLAIVISVVGVQAALDPDGVLHVTVLIGEEDHVIAIGNLIPIGLSASSALAV